MKRAWGLRTAALLAALACSLAGAAGARAAKGVVPAEGEWLGITTGGLPVSFTVAGGRVSDVHFSFEWGSCGRYEATGERPASARIDPVIAQWDILNPFGEYISGSFLAPERLEGRLVGIERDHERPFCPHAEENYAAELGRVPTYVRPQVYAIEDRRNGHQATRPHEIRIRPGLVFRKLHWETFSLPVARGSAQIVIRGPHGKAFEPVAHLTLTELVPRGEGETYKRLGYRLYGHLPPGTPRRGAFWMF